MEFKNKKNVNKSYETPRKFHDILPNDKYVENYINYVLKEKEKEKEKEKTKVNETETETEIETEIEKEIEKERKKNKYKNNNQRLPKQEINGDVEKQLKKLIEHLYSLKFKLEKDKKKEKEKEKEKENKINNSKDITKSKNTKHLENEILIKDDHYNTLGAINSSKKKCILKTSESNRKSSIVNHIPELIKTVEIYKNKNAEEIRNNRCIINKYESIIRNIKKQHIEEINEIKNTILEDVDFLIQKYRNIALELLEITKRKEKKNEAEKKKLIEICISACKKFEEDVKEKAKVSLQDYKDYMVKQNETIKREKEFLLKKIKELKKQMEQEKTFNEKKIFESCENKLKQENELNKKLKNQLVFERKQHTVLIGSLYSKIDEQIKIYEESIIKIMHGILEKNNVTMNIYELQKLIKNEMGEQYKKEQLEMEQKRQKELEKNKMSIKYGFTSIYNK